MTWWRRYYGLGDLPQHSDGEWFWRAYGRPSRPPMIEGLIDAPVRAEPSQALTQVREAMAQRDRRERERARWHIAGPAAFEREGIEELRPLVEQFGSEAVEKLTRRDDPTFRLPEALRGIKPQEKH